jgi:hypothetical protein
VKSGETRGANARHRSSNRSRLNRKLSRSGPNSDARLLAGHEESRRSSVRLRRLGKQSRRHGPTSVAVRRQVVPRASLSSSVR